ncbi:EmrB/QacA subfamily drug resistance transporter|uniref:EmrB/QacA subfamily drug resistance transporter n=1 Tax=Brenneria salicis ATCC 15712 = DSM 30166 TaxID=714314 RepID=A0A366IB69_9GAMM|nr:MDR family MFS transporter [Brenneria salicis]NMN91684.1 EmrB/QacA subfamily drug resistance transporter [Brenneria salicis ATCC 15712 = DSM 30166]RBP65742.1 EmrB/QacA subfamily drug resistance transporter [Brenneria salicis ATCC 15712 = DSM 30166]RLM31785.1 MFS transporter [Brenneria salicis ATCC 15712 = DSM 30166]
MKTANNSEHPPVAHRHWVLIACMLAMFTAAIEVTIVATALPTIIADLGGFSLLGWVFAGYLLTQAISIPIYGRLADLFGRKRIFFIGTITFLLGSVLCGFSTHMGWLILFRTIQGLGAGAITPIAFTIVADVYSSSERPKIQGYLSSVWGISAIIGPLLGAFIVQHFNWALVFWVNVPIGLLSIFLLARYLPSVDHKRPHQLDWAGAFYLAVTVASLLMALLQAEALGFWVIPLLIIAFVGGILLFRQESSTPEPLFPLALWRNKVIIAGNLGGLTIGAAMMGVSAFLPTFIQGVMGKTPLEAGSILASMSIGWPLASTLSGRLMLRTSYRFTAIIGGILIIAGSLVLLTLDQASNLNGARVAAFFIGAGMGLSNTTFLVSVQNAVNYSIRGIATASTMFTRMLGSALGTAILGATLNINLHWRLPELDDPLQTLMGGRNMMSTELINAISLQVATSIHWVFIVSALIAVLTLFSACMIPARQKPEAAR